MTTTDDIASALTETTARTLHARLDHHAAHYGLPRALPAKRWEDAPKAWRAATLAAADEFLADISSAIADELTAHHRPEDRRAALIAASNIGPILALFTDLPANPEDLVDTAAHLKRHFAPESIIARAEELLGWLTAPPPAPPSAPTQEPPQ